MSREKELREIRQEERFDKSMSDIGKAIDECVTSQATLAFKLIKHEMAGKMLSIAGNAKRLEDSVEKERILRDIEALRDILRDEEGTISRIKKVIK